jgi:hypothetical protein
MICSSALVKVFSHKSVKNVAHVTTASINYVKEKDKTVWRAE